MRNPYIIGTAVSGNRFYGRNDLINEILTSPKDCFCILGNRRLGKTSLLRQLEYLTTETNSPYFGVYWDLQGCKNEADLVDKLLDGLLDVEDQLYEIHLRYDDLEKEEDSLFDLLRLLRRSARQAGKRILLLCDECESLIGIGEQDRDMLAKLRGTMQDSRFVKTVIAASRRLSQISQIDLIGSPFLHGFEPVLFMGTLSEDEADELISQVKTNDGLSLPPEIASEIKEKTDRHPYLIQSLCSYFYEKEIDFQKACNFLMNQEIAEKAFADDYRYLSPVEKDILFFALESGKIEQKELLRRVGLDVSTLNKFLFTLSASGYIKPINGGGYAIANYFFARWLQNNSRRLNSILSMVSDDAVKALQIGGTVGGSTGGSPVRLQKPTAARIYLPQAIIVVDMCGHSAIVQKYGNHFFMELLSVLQDVVHTAAEQYHSNCLRGRGDGFLISFSTIEDALKATLEIQKSIKERNEGAAENEEISVRFAIHFGETLVDKDGEPYGEAVNMVFRVEALKGEQLIETQGGIAKSQFPQKDYILTTEVVYNDIRNRPGVDCRLLGLFELPGFVGLHRIYQIIV